MSQEPYTDQRSGGSQYKRVLITVADGARADLMKQLLNDGQLPNMREHLVERGCYRTVLTVFPSTTGPAHIPFVTGLHPGTANLPGYRWLSRKTHDARRRSIYRHRSLNSPRGIFAARDLDPDKTTALFEYFENPSSIMELISYCPNRRLYRVIIRHLLQVIRAHKIDNWDYMDRFVEKLIKKRIKAGSECIVGSFFGIDEYSHLYHPSDERTIGAYKNIDRAIGEIAKALKDEGVYDETIMAVVSDHGLSATTVHIPLVDIVKAYGFDPYFYPKLYRKRHDSAVCESGNAMAAVYFKRGDRWGDHWNDDEIQSNPRTRRLVDTLLKTEGVSFVASRMSGNGVMIRGASGNISAIRADGHYRIAIEGENPLREHPEGTFKPEDLFRETFNHTYPDAVNQLFMLFASERSGDIAISSDPGYDLRLQYEYPEHHSSHGSLHREQMHVPLLTNLPIKDDYFYNYDLAATILAATGRTPKVPIDGRVLSLQNGYPMTLTPSGSEAGSAEGSASAESEDKKRGLSSIIITLAIIIGGIILTAIFKEDIQGLGEYLMTTAGETWVDVILFALTAVSSSPLALPVWVYALVGISMGIPVLRLAAVMAVGSASGSLITFLVGKHFSNTQWVKKRFPRIHEHPWTKGKSRTYVTLLLFLGTASPIPCDVFYVACGAKKYPTLLFWVTMTAARFVRYIYLGYGFTYFREFFDKFM